MFKANYHTHTYRCKHAVGTVEDYCRVACAEGLKILGITDHAALPDNRWLGVRMDISELPDYCAEIDAARGVFPQLTVLTGMECEYDKGYHAFFQDELLGRLNFSYLVGAVHWFPHAGEWRSVYSDMTNPGILRSYSRHCIATMESGLFAFLAHPDVFGTSYPTWDAEAEACSRDILSAAADLRVPLEINGYGLRKPLKNTPDGVRHGYPWRNFWDAAGELKIKVLVTSDAHAPEDVTGKMDEAAALASGCGLTLSSTLGHLKKN